MSTLISSLDINKKKKMNGGSYIFCSTRTYTLTTTETAVGGGDVVNVCGGKRGKKK
jgi:hypothetical protein